VSNVSRAESFLRDLQSAVSSRRLYAPDHPRNIDVLAKLEAHVAALTASRAEFSALSDADRLVTDDGHIESHVPIARGIFRALNSRGFERLTVQRGVTRSELAGFIDAIVAHDTGGTTALTPSAHLTFSRLVRQGGSRSGGGAGIGAWGGGFVSGGDVPLERVWLSVESGPIELDMLEGLVLALGHTVTHNRDALIPLVQLQSHDAYTVTHITNVAVLSMAIASALGFSADFVHDQGTAALLHDVGKLKVPVDVLTSPTKLTEAQLVLMKRHPEDGARMLMGAGRLPDLAAIVAFEHHLQFDGGGYPAVPAGWRSHVASEITHVADVYDALRSDRPYRKGLPPETAAQMMSADAGRVFDPFVLKVFFEQVAPRLTWRSDLASKTSDDAEASMLPGAEGPGAESRDADSTADTAEPAGPPPAEGPTA
jgi:HD-GYP domain-containing protein (c-di-GMP phosphodiesterase class II)